VLGWVGLAVPVLAVGVLTASLIGTRQFERSATRLVERLAAAPVSDEPASDRLPPLMQAYVERSRASGCGGLVRLTQKAEMRLQQGGSWIPVSAVQTSAISVPGFVWNARANVGALPATRVIDYFVDGEGALEARVAGLVRVANASGPAATRGEAMRYLSELPWTPHAIACNAALAWRELGSGKVEVSMETTAGRAALVYTFDAEGDVATVAGQRSRDETGEITPWEGVFSDYREIGGVRIPARGEVAWVEDGEPFTYFRGEIVALEVLPQPAAQSS